MSFLPDFLNNLLKSKEVNHFIYTVSFVRQYSNASVLHVTVDWDSTTNRKHPPLLELYLGEAYHCRSSGGGGTEGHVAHEFIITPTLPDDLSKLQLHFYHEDENDNQENSTEFVILVD
ncbi:MAG: hypothetical protein ABF649_08810 [Bacillus sp. (in: firmicutes)]